MLVSTREEEKMNTTKNKNIGEEKGERVNEKDF